LHFVTALVGRAAWAQSQYYNLDGGRPTRIEDAEPTALHALDIDFAPFRVERVMDGSTRYRAEPKLEYGVLPFTDLEIRVPIVRVQPSQGRGTTGAAGVSIGAMHAFNLETTAIPALALSGEWSIPAGQLSGPQNTFLLEGLATKTTRLGRLHLNAGAGTYSVRTTRASPATQCLFTPFTLSDANGCSTGPPIIIDTPCDVAPPVVGRVGPSFERVGGENTLPSRACMAAQPADAVSTSAATPPAAMGKSFGTHLIGGIGFDHAFALQSMLIAADVFTEHFDGLYARPDWNAEIGIRRQVTPTVLIDAGIGRKFAGVVHSTSLILGATYEIPTPALARHR
jgi:hypothetical protein